MYHQKFWGFYIYVYRPRLLSQQMNDPANAMCTWSLMTSERLLGYPRRGYSPEIRADVLFAMLFKCPFPRSFRSKEIP
jgi:hypothetical protein